jgi:hypothetical protein
MEIPFSSSADYEEAHQASVEMFRILQRRRAPSGSTPPSGEPAFTYESCYLRELRTFLDVAAGKAPYPASIAGELRTVSVVDAIQRSAAEQREVKV